MDKNRAGLLGAINVTCFVDKLGLHPICGSPYTSEVLKKTRFWVRLESSEDEVVKKTRC